MADLVDENDRKTESSPVLSADAILTTVYDVNRAIFRHLPIHSIDSCSLVCQSWAHLARLTKTHRHTIHTLTYPSDPMSSTAKAPFLLADFDQFLSSFVRNGLWSLPALAFVVATNNLERKGFQSASDVPPPAKCSKRSHSPTAAAATRRTDRCDISQALKQHLNKSCHVLTVVSDAIVASNDENQTNEIEQDDAMGILLLPKFPSNVLGIYPFEIPNKTKISASMSRSDLHRYLGGVPDDIPIRSVIFFSPPPLSHTANCLKKLLEYYPSQVAIIGGYINRSRYDDRQTERKTTANNACGIVLTGDQSHLHIRQVILNNQIQTREEIRERLKVLNSAEYQTSSFSFAIQISCVARGLDFYNQESNVECSEFRRLFPKTPLIGVFGNGELGHDYLPSNDQSVQSESHAVPAFQDICHSYSTIFSLISIRL